MFGGFDCANAFNTTIRGFQIHSEIRYTLWRSEADCESARSMRSRPPQSETHTAGSRAFLAHRKALLESLVKRRVAGFGEYSAGPSGLFRSPAAIDQQQVSSEQGFHE